MIDRRNFLKASLGAGLALTGLAACGRSEPVSTDEQPTLPVTGQGDAAKVFPSSVASGDPTPSGAIIWTRIAAEAFKPDLPLYWQIANDVDFKHPVASGKVAAGQLSADHDYTMKVDVDGHLAADRFYFYRFAYDNTSSKIGRLRTLPTADASPEKLRLILLSCQDYTLAYFHGYGEIANIEADYLLHVGDFIYESAIVPLRPIALPSGGTFASSLADSRTIYRTHRSDANLQAALERHTLIHTWDDHEIANDRYFDGTRPRGPDHPLDGNAEAMTQYCREAIQAWHEYLPVRLSHYDPQGSFPDLIEVQRSFRFGKLAELVLTELRMHRSPHPCGEGNYGQRQLVVESACIQRNEPDRTQLGTAQREWMLNQLSNSNAIWRVLGLPQPFSPLQISPLPPMVYETENWDGYTAERSLILNEMKRRQVPNLVVLAGDLHAFLAGTLLTDYDGDGAAVGVEFCTSAIAATPIATVNPPANAFLQSATVQAQNPHLALWDGTRNGWCEVEFTPGECRVTMRGMLAQLPLPNPSVALTQFRVAAGSTVLERIA